MSARKRKGLDPAGQGRPVSEQAHRLVPQMEKSLSVCVAGSAPQRQPATPGAELSLAQHSTIVAAQHPHDSALHPRSSAAAAPSHPSSPGVVSDPSPSLANHALLPTASLSSSNLHPSLQHANSTPARPAESSSAITESS